MNSSDDNQSGPSTKPRVCVFSPRNVCTLVSRCADYEFEDVICEIDDATLIAPTPSSHFAITRKIVNKLGKKCAVSRLNPGLSRVKLEADYDLFFAKPLFVGDLLLLNALSDWRSRCRMSICWLAESWVDQLKNWPGHLKVLSRFDFILLNCSASAEPIQKITGRPSAYIAPGVDAIEFCPYPEAPERCIDVYSMGRRSEITHSHLMDMAEGNNTLYIYDTTIGLYAKSWEHHRRLVANLAKRSRYFIANAAKIDCASETHGQSEIGYRFFEGAAAGAVLIGDPPRNEVFKENFDWPDAVINLPFDSPDIGPLLSELDSQPERINLARRNNIVNSLLRHDWVHRWRKILELAGMEPTDRTLAREEQLRQLAAAVQEI